MKKKWWIVLIVVILLIIGGGIAWYLLLQKQAEYEILVDDEKSEYERCLENCYKQREGGDRISCIYCKVK